MNELALCAGNGGMSLGLRLAVPSARTICYVEREAFAVEHLATKGRSSFLDEAPVWSDLTEFDGIPWRGVVDIVTAGFPCQPFSVAGKQLGTADDRWLWPDIECIIGEVEPRMVFLENVPGLVQHGLGHVLRGLARHGFDAEWDLFSAAQVGAPHLRRRVFILASHPDRRSEPTQPVDGEAPGMPGMDAANAKGLLGPAVLGCQSHRVATRGGPVADTNSEGLEGRDSQELQECPTEQPARTGSSPVGDTDSTRTVAHPEGGGSRDPASQPSWWDAEPNVGRVADGVADRVDRLRSIGNGVVPLAVAYAFRTLEARLSR